MTERDLLGRLALRLRKLRGTLLVLLASPLLPALFLSLFGGEQQPILGLLLGMGLIGLGVLRLRRGRVRQGAILVGVATGLAAAMAAGVAPLGAAVFGLMAWFGTTLLYTDTLPAEEAPPPPDALTPVRQRLSTLEKADPRLGPALVALRDLVADLSLRSGGAANGVPEARRFLNLQLDGLERIESRLRLGAEPPHGLVPLVAEMARGSQALRERLRREEKEALEIQVKVLADRLREEGYA
ncbi:hypothetical protein [Teichococcus oryzae]|uniref:Uncharacterized protein n=1 Tax=Teichococcus oryzae TaxID=1608942 RepID=A0A5B2TKR2_9PROT|nr:hypothetical protein [Pseudoroseomonas oryzae]KAA2215041.1 hypothetical protein F0Q34_05065 [Pseudoroseomonas oryzae]